MAGESSNGGAWVVGVVARAPTNIAVIKYWGKRDEKLVLPLNDSLSLTLDPDDLCATTSILASPLFTRDRLWLNGKEVSLGTHRYQSCLNAIRARGTSVTRVSAPLARREGEEWAIETGGAESERTVSAEEWRTLNLHIISANNFPTAAGLASSAAGFACLVNAAASLMGVVEAYPGELTTFARMGSGSACRSLYGGFVKWSKGQREDGSDSVAQQVAPPQHWPEIAVLVAVVNDASKDVSSTGGMASSVITSPLLEYRAEVVVPERMRQMEEAVSGRNFAEFVKVTCCDSNQFHAVCLDTSPPIFYLNQTSKKIIGLVEHWNRETDAHGTPLHQAAYTFDAGPNAVMFVKREDAQALMSLLLHHFPPSDSVDPHRYVVGKSELAEEMREIARRGPKRPPTTEEQVKYFICTSVGQGASVLSWKPSFKL